MIQEFKLPDLGEGIHEGEILEVKVSQGDKVKEGDVILVVETDKAAVEIPSPYTGVVDKVHVKPNDMVHVGEVMIAFEVEGAEEKPQEVAPAASETPPPAKEAVKKEGEKGKPKEGAPPAPKAPPAKAAAEEVPEKAAPSAEPPPAEGAAEVKAAPKKRKGPVPASPATRRLARELGVDLNAVSGSGPAGLVTAEDVRAHAGKPKEAPEAAAPEEVPTAEEALIPGAVPTAMPTLPDFSQWGAVERIPLRSVRRAVAKKMALSWSQIPHVSHHELVDITDLEAIRKQSKKEVEEHGGKLTLLVFALKAAVGALETFPNFNASLDLEHEEIVQKKYYHLGVAIDTERGLVVPVIRDVDRKSMLELAIELPQIAQKTRDGKLTLDDVKGATFTITNIGAIGGSGFQPIINFPEVAILGLGSARWQPVVRQNDKGVQEIVPRLILPLVISFDHRVLDGAEAARFVNDVKESLENPARMLFHE